MHVRMEIYIYIFSAQDAMLSIPLPIHHAEKMKYLTTARIASGPSRTDTARAGSLGIRPRPGHR